MEAAAPQPPPSRLASLDVFRGATVALMILVNNPGDWKNTYWPLLHVPWHGCTPTDLVFPFFLFIVGVAIPFAFAPRLAASDGAVPPGLRIKIVRRAAILFGLGMLGTLFPFYTVVLERVRFPGVLQRIAIVYLCAAFVYLYLRPKARVLLAAGLLAFYWAVMKLAPVPGFGAGDLSPQGNFAFWLDHIVLGQHTWRGSPGPGDPEGILSTLPAIVTALSGIFCGELLRGDSSAREKLQRLFGWGAGATAAGLALAPLFPLNKNLWSPTYVLFTSGLALFCLAATWYLVDLRRIDFWAGPFEIFGKNAILAFVGSGLLAKSLLVVFRWQEGEKTVNLQSWLYQNIHAVALPPYLASLAWALSTVLFWLALLAVLDRKGIYLKV
jgi:predicted acyltransferase